MPRSVAAATIAAVLGPKYESSSCARTCGDRGGDVERLVVDRRQQQRVAGGQRAARDLFVAGAEHHAVDAALRGAARLAEAGRHAGQVQQLDHHVLEHVAGPGAFVQPLQEAAALADAAVVLDQRRQLRDQPLVEAGQAVRRQVFQRAEVEPDLERRRGRSRGSGRAGS